MVQILIILAFFAARAQDVLGLPSSGQDTPTAPTAWWGPALPFLALLVMWIVFHAFTRHAGITIDRTGRLTPLSRAHAMMTTARITVLAVLIASVLLPGIAWADRVRTTIGNVVLLDELVIASPLLLILVLTWWSVEPLERRVHDAMLLRSIASGVTLHAPQSRVQWVWTQVRHQMLLVLIPICLVLGWTETIDTLPGWLHTDPTAWWLEALHWVGIALVLLLTPLFLRFVWSTVRLGDGPLRDQILAVCRSYGVRVVGPLVWRTHGSLVNAAILGIFYPFRYLLLSDAMLERLPREQLEVVLAHEVAHVRRRHMLWTGIAVFSVVTGAAMVIALAAQFLHLPAALEPIVSGSAAIVSITVGFLVFGFVSRRFEWDADAFAAAHMARITSSQPDPVIIAESAVAATIATLQSVADCNGMSTRKFTFRHGSIAYRQFRVSRLLGVPVHRMPITRQVMWIKIAALVLLALSLVPLILGVIFERASP